ncbi:AMP deaminase [Madurella fahalii]|uniref:AMP deaminase n=1 Tax=Madurella fahalii TaxID=1157608 RepID=A0ABQ0G0T3_9PEZI
MSQLESDDEEYRPHDQSGTESDGLPDGQVQGGIEAGESPDEGHEPRGEHAGTADMEMEDGMLARDLPQKTAFYDLVAERQMTQTDAKLFYQRRQADARSPMHPSAQFSPQGSPLLSAGPGPGSSQMAADLPSNLGNSLSSLRLSELDSGTIPEPEPGHPLKRETSYFGADNLPSRGSYAQVNNAAVPSGNQIDAAVQQQTPLNTGSFAGVGNSAYTDEDPQITAELSTIFKSIQKVLDIRRKYIRLSLQGPNDNPKDDPSWNIYPPPPEPAWTEEREKAARSTTGQNSANNSLQNSLVLNVDKQRPGDQASDQLPETPRKSNVKRRKAGQDIGEDFDMDDLMPMPGPSEMTFRLDDNGVYQVYENAESDKAGKPIVNVPTIKEYYLDLEEILNVSSDGPSKSFAFRRLQYLEGKFNLYVLLNEYQETADSKRVPHRDFYNVRKVDTHVHHSACMNQKHLLRFIKSKMKKYPDEIVLYRDGKHLTLAEVFESINLTAYDLSIDTLDMHAHKDSFHRFDKFNLKYNPIGESRLRTIFLKTDNFIKGRYLAEITKEVIADLESSKYQMVEWRISIYGKSIDEWDKLAAWVIDNKLFSHNVRWLIQIPRLYDVYKSSGLMNSFEQIIKNLFQPLFEVTKDPSSHPKLHIFLQRVVGLDSVDDESKVERRLFKKFPVPKVWDTKQNPPYTYWIYHLFANLMSLNTWRKQRGFNTFVLRPHCGEAGDSEHLAVAALCCHSISHGLLLRKVPLLQYIFYLEQIGIAMSPLSNNALFLAYERNPFHQYFKRGLNVSLSTDDPLQFAFTKEPLIEEYAVAAQIYKLSSVDMCELAKNSVKQSGYEFSIKQQWLGPNFHLPGAKGNTMVKTNVPDRREEFRFHTLLEELRMVERYTALATDVPSASGSAVDPNSVPLPVTVPRSPALSSRATTIAADPKQQSHAQGSTPTWGPQVGTGSPSIMAIPTSLSQSQLYSSPVLASPMMGPASDRDLSGSWTQSDSIREPHLSGHEPRYFPGMVSRSQRKDSTRQSSVHESDEGGSRKAPSRRDTYREGPSE